MRFTLISALMMAQFGCGVKSDADRLASDCMDACEKFTTFMAECDLELDSDAGRFCDEECSGAQEAVDAECTGEYESLTDCRSSIEWEGVECSQDEIDALRSDCDDEEQALADCLAPPQVDILYVIDGSSSMSDELTSLLQNASVFFDKNIDYRLAITTSSMSASDGWFREAEGGETGLFVGDVPVVSSTDSDASHRFKQNAACWAGCWDSYEIVSDPSYLGASGECPEPDSNGDGEVTSEDEVSTQYLDCLCTDADYPEGEDWDAIELCRSGNELHLESTLMAMCRASDAPPEVCSHSQSPFSSEWAGSNGGWLRPDSTVVVVIVTDEGDQSESAVDGLISGSSDDPQPYLDAFAEFGFPIVVSVIGPDLQCVDDRCDFECNNGGASVTGVKRLMNMAEATGGFYNPITTDECGASSFRSHFNDLSRLINNL